MGLNIKFLNFYFFSLFNSIFIYHYCHSLIYNISLVILLFVEYNNFILHYNDEILSYRNIIRYDNRYSFYGQYCSFLDMHSMITLGFLTPIIIDIISALSQKIL